ncbi:MAG: aminotransferase class V-fold PLP-dependent enzyme [Planctomycetota bacterium]
MTTAPVQTTPTARAHQPARWPIEPGLTMLNHGSYGVCPEYIHERQSELRREMDADPVKFFLHKLEAYADRARVALGSFINADPADLALVQNGTFAVATCLHAIDWQPGDRVVVTDHEYNATLNELNRLVRTKGIEVVHAKVPLPCTGPDQIAAAVEAQINDKTKLVIASHIASASALVMPVEQIVHTCREKGIEVLIDGAHAPGQIPLDLKALRPTYYAASCHKWLCTPKGAAFFYADKSVHHKVQPLALSCRVHESRDDRAPFLCDFDYVGTGDYTAFLTLPDCIEHLAAQRPGGWDQIRTENHQMVLAGARTIRETCDLPETYPDHLADHMTGCMYSLLLPPDPDPSRKTRYADALHDRIIERHNVQVPIWTLETAGVRVARISAQIHNRPEQYEYFAEALRTELEAERTL